MHAVTERTQITLTRKHGEYCQQSSLFVNCYIRKPVSTVGNILGGMFQYCDPELNVNLNESFIYFIYFSFSALNSKKKMCMFN